MGDGAWVMSAWEYLMIGNVAPVSWGKECSWFGAPPVLIWEFVGADILALTWLQSISDGHRAFRR